MSKIIRSIVIISFILSLSISAQVPKKILMEYATNASCPPCATWNDDVYALLKNNYENIVSVWYHAWWPGPGDPMYVANKQENEDRIYYYDINGVPNYVFNGTKSNFPGYWNTFTSDYNSQQNLTSPVSLEVKAVKAGDSLQIYIEIVVVDTVLQTNLTLRTAVYEQLIIYNKSPGSNGEKEFPNVFRKFINGPGGTAVNNINVGDTLKYNFTQEIDSTWNKERLAVAAWLQSDDTKEVVQSGTNLKFHDMTTEAPSIQKISKNQTIVNNYTVSNPQSDTLHVEISIAEIENPTSWNYYLSYDGTNYDILENSIPPGNSLNFDLTIETDSIPGYINLKIASKNIGHSAHFSTDIISFNKSNLELPINENFESRLFKALI